MRLELKNVSVYKDDSFVRENYFIDIDPSSADLLVGKISNFNDICILPAFCDVHVHFREPGFFYKETIKSGSMAAARGGYTDVCTMPNLKPVPDCFENLKIQLDIIKGTSVIGVHPYASISKNEMGKELSDFDGLTSHCVAFSDDGRGVQSDDLMREAMLKAKQLNKIIAAHCEVNSLLNGGYINDGEYAREHGHRGICGESEWLQVERDLKLAKETGCKYHVCHISTAESVDLIRKAKAEGVDVTCETAPHYLIFDDSLLKEDGRFKMNPPLRSTKDRLALIEGIKDGTIDMIATDHAPHTKEEKSRGLRMSLMGVVGLEVAFPIMYTFLVKTRIITFERLIELMAINPRKRFGIEMNDDLCIWDLGVEYEIDPSEFLSMGRSTPFEGMRVNGRNLITIRGGKIVWQSVR